MNIAVELEKIIPQNRIRARFIDLISFASDAGFYHLVPKAVVQPVNEQEIIALFAFSQAHRVPLVFRTGGTSLSGQAITDGILVDLSQNWRTVKIENEGESVRVQPGITGAMVNAYLKRFNQKIGPDPSSISAAMMGGILSNNASGMCCGVKLNSYHTTQFIRFILPNGNTFSTENADDYARFEHECADISQTLLDIKRQIEGNRALFNKIRVKYQTKTTIGYSLNAFIDYTHPLDILAHLLVGAEGTLAFIAEAVLKTVPDYPHKSAALLYFSTIYDACQAIVPLTDSGAQMVELMDRASLRSIDNLDGIPDFVKNLPESAAALLVEFQENTPEDLDARVNHFLASSSNMALLNAPLFTKDAKEQAFFWKVRKGLFPAVGAVRASGTTVILEDVAVPVAKLGDAILDLQELFKKYAYHNAIIFGHAKDGNIHFVVTQSFNTEGEILRYDRFLKEVVTLVVEKYDGTLKAEHGTGRNMSPFVETEWGGEAYEIMKKIKQTIDPHNLLNPDVIINKDANAHLKNLKELPSVEEEVDKCIECGYCEHRCPSRDITATPRRRIVIRRALQTLKTAGDTPQYKLLLAQSEYDSLDTCAVDGLCATACPVDINTGDLIKRLRRENHSNFANKTAFFVAKNFKTVEKTMRFALKMGHGINAVLGKKAMTNLTFGLKKGISGFPIWSLQMSTPPNLDVLKNKKNADEIGKIVYFPACISRMLGTYEGKEKNLMETFLSVCTKAKIPLSILDNVNGSCCSQIFASKGYSTAYQFSANKIVEQMWSSSHEGQHAIVIDVSSCAYTLHHLRPVLTEENKKKYDKLTIMDSVQFLHDRVLPKIDVKNKKKSIVLHPVCSLEKMKTEAQFLKIAQQFAEHVSVPKNAGCCGMAGDRGFMLPKLTASATNMEAQEVNLATYEGYYSSTKTCEMAMSEAVKKNYMSILYLVDEAI